MSLAIAPDTQALEVQSGDLQSRFAAILITDFRAATVPALQRSLEASAVIAHLADDLEREVENSQRPVVKDLHDLHAKALAELNRLKGPATSLKKVAGQLGYSCNAELRRRQEELERLAREEQARRQREADEAARIEQEAAQRAQDDALIEEAARLDQAGDQEAANRLIAAPPPAPVVRAAPVFVPPPPRLALEVKGQTFGETWGDYEVADASRIPREYCLLDDKKIRGVIRTMKASTNIPGIRVSDPRPKTTVRQTA